MLKLRVTQMVNKFEALEKETAFSIFKKRCKRNLSRLRPIQPTPYCSLFSPKVAMFRALYANSHLAVTSQFLEGFCRKLNVVFPQLLIQIQSKYCYTFRLPAMVIVKTFRKPHITVLTLQRGVTGTARMLHALTHSSISRQVREQM